MAGAITKGKHMDKKAVNEQLASAATDLISVAQEMLIECHATRLALVEAIDPSNGGNVHEADKEDLQVIESLDALIDRANAAVANAKGIIYG